MNERKRGDKKSQNGDSTYWKDDTKKKKILRQKHNIQHLTGNV